MHLDLTLQDILLAYKGEGGIFEGEIAFVKLKILS